MQIVKKLAGRGKLFEAFYKMAPVNSPSKEVYHSSPEKIGVSIPTTTVTTAPKPTMKPFMTISVDGNISSGKSTLVSALKDVFPKSFNYAVEIVPEPLEKWTNVGGHNLLEMLYEDSAKNNFLFQHYVQLTRLMDTVKQCEVNEGEENYLGKIRIMERSIQNNRYCFSELARRQGTLHEAEFSVIAEWYKWLEEHTELPLDLIIYLRTSPEVVYQRMRSRGRSEESTVPLKYLSELHETYEDWLVRGNGDVEEGDKNYKVLIVDADKSRDEVAEDCKKLVNEFFKKKQGAHETTIPSPVKKLKLDSQ